MPLITESNFHEPGKRYFHPYQAGDDFYQVLIDTHRDLAALAREALGVLPLEQRDRLRRLGEPGHGVGQWSGHSR